MDALITWFGDFMASLPPLLQLILGMLLGLGVFKLLTMFVNWKDNKNQDEKK